MNKRARTLWVPALVSLTVSMTWRLILQQTVQPGQKLLNHAGLPLYQQLFWLAALPGVGAVSAYLCRRAGGGRLSAATVAVFPSAVMIPFWIAFAVIMRLPSPSQWFGLLAGVLNWVVLPGVALLLGAWPFLKAQPAIDWNIRMNRRTAIFWLPALISLAAAMTCLAIVTFVAMQPRFLERGLATSLAYVPWLSTLPFCGAAGAYLSRRGGGGRLASLAAALFPMIAITGLVSLLAFIGEFVFAQPRWFYISSAVLMGAILPGTALLIGAVPFGTRHAPPTGG